MKEYRKIEDGYESKVEPGRMVLLGIGILLTVILIFLVGVLVGKGLWAGRGSASVVQAEGRPEPAPAPGAPKYTFYDDLKQPDSRETPIRAPAPPAEDAATTPVVAARTEKVPGVLGPEGPTPPTDGAAPVGPQTVPSRESPPRSAGAPVPQGEQPAPERGRPVRAEAEPALRAESGAGLSAPKREAPAPAAKEVAKPKEPAQSDPHPKLLAKQKDAPQPAPEKGKTAAAEASPKPEAKLPSASFTVQIGSYKERGPADQQVRQVGQKGVAAHVTAVTVQGRTWYRVHVGQFGTRAEAESHFKKKLKPQGVQGFVTPR